MSAVTAAETALRLAEGTLARINAEIEKSEAREKQLHAALSSLYAERDSAACSDPGELVARIAAMQSEHDAARAATKELRRMLDQPTQRVRDARMRLGTARRQAAMPEAAKKEKATREAFRKAAALLRDSIEFREANDLPATGLTAFFAEDGKGLYAELEAYGIAPDLTRLR